MKFLEGKKTWIVVVVSLVYAVSAYLYGSIPLDEAINIGIISSGFGGLRDAVAKK